MEQLVWSSGKCKSQNSERHPPLSIVLAKREDLAGKNSLAKSFSSVLFGATLCFLRRFLLGFLKVCDDTTCENSVIL